MIWSGLGKKLKSFKLAYLEGHAGVGASERGNGGNDETGLLFSNQYTDNLDTASMGSSQGTANGNDNSNGDNSREGISFTALPVEIIERIIAKCQENDVEILESETTGMVERVYGAGTTTSNQEDAENGWETDEEDQGEEDEEEEEESTHAEDGVITAKERKAMQRELDDMHDTYNDIMAKCLDCGEYHEDAVTEDSHPKGKLPKPPVLAVQQLAKTCKALWNLALPFVFRGIDFEAMPNRALQRFIDDILPKYAHLIKELWLRVSLNENQEFIQISWTDADDPLEYQSQKRYDLALTILQALPNLIKIDIDLPTTHAYIPPPQTTIQDIISQRGEHLTRLCLTADAYDSRLLTSSLCPILVKLPKLEMLELSGVETQSSHGLVLKDVIASMPLLQYLEMDDALCVNDEWAEADWKCGLKSLSLDDCQNMTDVGVEAWLQRHRQTLHSITLDMVPYQGAAALNDGPPYDFPKLQDLSLENSDMTISFLQRFALCPNLFRIQLGHMDEIDLKQLSTLIEQSRSKESNQAFPALKDLCLSVDWLEAESDAAMESLELVCFENGISLAVEPEDEDDDDDEDDDEDYDSLDLEEAEGEIHDEEMYWGDELGGDEDMTDPEEDYGDSSDNTGGGESDASVD